MAEMNGQKIDKMREFVVFYETNSSLIAPNCYSKCSRDLMGKYIAWKVKRKYKRFVNRVDWAIIIRAYNELTKKK